MYCREIAARKTEQHCRMLEGLLTRSGCPEEVTAVLLSQRPLNYQDSVVVCAEVLVKQGVRRNLTVSFFFSHEISMTMEIEHWHASHILIQADV